MADFNNHRNAVLGQRHATHNWEFDNAALREAESIPPADNLNVSNLKKMALQLDDHSLWMLIDSVEDVETPGAYITTWRGMGVDAVYTFSEQSGDYTLVLSDKDKKIITMTSSSANALIVPLHADVPLPLGVEIHVVQKGTGQTTITPADVAINLLADPGLKLRARYCACTLIQEEIDVWYCWGGLSA